MLEITKMLTLSTAHIRPETGKALEIEADTNDMGLTVYDKGGSGETYGWFIMLTQDATEEYRKAANENKLPRDLYNCIALALDMDCEILCLDCDGPVMPYLTQHTWDD